MTADALSLSGAGGLWGRVEEDVAEGRYCWAFHLQAHKEVPG
jgi:hypothetical protein